MIKDRAQLSLFNKLATIMLIICPIIQTYGWGKYDFAFIGTVLLSLVYLLFCNPRCLVPKWLGRYLLYCCISTLLSVTSFASLIQMSIIRIFLAYLMFFDVVDGNYLILWYKRIGYVCLGFFFIQEALYYGMGLRISGIFEFLPLSVAEDAAGYYDKVMSWTRSASFYSEPSYLAQALFPLLCIELFDSNYDTKKKKYIKVAIIIFALLLLQSGTALLGLVAISLYYIIFLVKTTRSSLNIILIIISIILAMFVGSVYFRSSMGQSVLSRQDQLSLNASSGQSGFIRIYRGYFVYDNYTMIEKIIGMFNGEVIQDKIKSSSVAGSFGVGDMSFNVIQNILLRTGIIGMIIILFYILSLWKNAPPICQAMIVVICVMSFIEALYFKEMMTLYLVFVTSIKNN